MSYFQVNKDDEEDAYEYVRRGHAWAAIEFPYNYSSALSQRIDLGRYAPDEAVELSNMKITMDMSSKSAFF